MYQKKLKVVVIGYGHIGSFAARAVLLAPDMELCGVVATPRSLEKVRQALPQVPVTTDVFALPEKPEAAILAVPTRTVEELAPKLLEAGIHTVDCFDMHGDPFLHLRESLQAAAVKGKVAAIMGSGVDPGVSTIVRALFEIWAPTGMSYVSYGPGMSMGHTVAAKSYDGVKDALSITRPGDPGCHKRDLYLVLQPGADRAAVKSAILADPYFSHDDVRVFFVDDVTPMVDMGHRIHIFRKGGSSGVDNQILTFETTFHNPASTAQVMAASARACTRLAPGAYTMFEVPPIAFLAGDTETLIKRIA
ncbi:MAG: diaminopimelate dehydrogenase [Anaerolineae bacterium]|nr:diaminopimelate dehydrogenase [Anaerolineae bacterium]